MRYVFRVDNSYKLGSGHLMRCLNLAKKLNGEIHFICRNLPKNNNHLILKNQFILHEFDSEDIELESELSDESFLISKLIDLKPDCVIIDHYGIGQLIEKEVQSLTNRILVIDDLDRDHIDECAVLDQNFKSSFNYKTRKQFLGPKFAVLNQSFKPSLITSSKATSLKNILVYFGASDVGQFTKMTYKVADQFPNLNFTFIVGLNSPDIEFFENIKDEKVMFFVNDMALKMSESDLFIGAVGTTSLERAYLGIPSVCVSLSDNQVKIAQDLTHEKIHILLGHLNTVDEELISSKISELIKDTNRLNSLKVNSLNLGVQSEIDQVISYLNTEI